MLSHDFVRLFLYFPNPPVDLFPHIMKCFVLAKYNKPELVCIKPLGLWFKLENRNIKFFLSLNDRASEWTD